MSNAVPQKRKPLWEPDFRISTTTPCCLTERVEAPSEPYQRTNPPVLEVWESSELDRLAALIRDATPDNNGLHDQLEFFVGYDILKFNFSVYNRWGQLLFQTDQAGSFWDGQFKNQPAPNGVYTYILGLEKMDGSKESRGGNITLVR